MINNSTNKVFTYYEAVRNHGHPQELIELWKESWRRHGWEPVVLSLDHARRHPLFLKFNVSVAIRPSHNPPGYDAACWRRWLAFAVAGGGVLTDYDVINRSLMPPIKTEDPVLICEWTRVPCMVHASVVGAESIVQWMMKPVTIPVGAHYSDMIWFQASSFPHTGTVCREFNHPEWEDAAVVHFSTGACRRHDKANFVNKAVTIRNVTKDWLA